MTLIELQKVLGDRITLTLQDGKTGEQRQMEIEESALIIETAKQMINNGDLILRTEKLVAQTKQLQKSYAYTLIAGDDEYTGDKTYAKRKDNGET